MLIKAHFPLVYPAEILDKVFDKLRLTPCLKNWPIRYSGTAISKHAGYQWFLADRIVIYLLILIVGVKYGHGSKTTCAFSSTIAGTRARWACTFNGFLASEDTWLHFTDIWLPDGRDLSTVDLGLHADARVQEAKHIWLSWSSDCLQGCIRTDHCRQAIDRPVEKTTHGRCQC